MTNSKNWEDARLALVDHHCTMHEAGLLYSQEWLSLQNGTLKKLESLFLRHKGTTASAVVFLPYTQTSSLDSLSFTCELKVSFSSAYIFFIFIEWNNKFPFFTASNSNLTATHY